MNTRDYSNGRKGCCDITTQELLRPEAVVTAKHLCYGSKITEQHHGHTTALGLGKVLPLFQVRQTHEELGQPDLVIPPHDTEANPNRPGQGHHEQAFIIQVP